MLTSHPKYYCALLHKLPAERKQHYLQGLCIPDLYLSAISIPAPGPLGVFCGPLQSVRVPEELRLDVPHNHWLASVAELLLEDSVRSTQSISRQGGEQRAFTEHFLP